jgi:protein TonB
MSDATGTVMVSTLAEPDGTFRVAMPEGERRTNLNAPGFTVKAFSYGAANLLRDPLRISAADSAEFSITLSFTGVVSTTGAMTGVLTAGTISTIGTPFGPITTPPTGAFGFTTIPPAITNAPPTSTAVVRVGSDVAAANLISRVDPIYPDAARAIQLSGVVVLSVEIGRDGKVEAVSAISGHPLLVQPAIDAVKQWRYQPISINNQPTGVVTTLNVSFQYR